MQTTVQGENRCLNAGDQFADCVGCPDMVVVPAGSFMMGSPKNEKDRSKDEGPQHKVTLRNPLAVGKFEVTVAQFNDFVSDTNYNATACGNGDDHPVACVSWLDAKAYVNWLSKKSGVDYRLLTESEWEYAARAGTTTAFATGKTITANQANYNRDKGGTSEVGSYDGNSFGLYDMAGNVWEWTEDCYKDSYKFSDASGKAIQSSSCKRVGRGGGWGSVPLILRSAVRFRHSSDDRNDYLGFRLARTF